MSKIVRKIYHIRKYDNIEHESKARLIQNIKGDTENTIHRMNSDDRNLA